MQSQKCVISVKFVKLCSQWTHINVSITNIIKFNFFKSCACEILYHMNRKAIHVRHMAKMTKVNKTVFMTFYINKLIRSMEISK